MRVSFHKGQNQNHLMGWSSTDFTVLCAVGGSGRRRLTSHAISENLSQKLNTVILKCMIVKHWNLNTGVLKLQDSTVFDFKEDCKTDYENFMCDTC